MMLLGWKSVSLIKTEEHTHGIHMKSPNPPDRLIFNRVGGTEQIVANLQGN